MKLSALLAFALVCCARSLAAQESVGTPDSGVAVAFHQEDQTIKGTVTIPAGTCVFAAFRSPRMWEGYVRGAFEFAVDPDVPVGSVTFDLEAAVTPRAGNFVGLTSSWKLRKPARVCAASSCW